MVAMVWIDPEKCQFLKISLHIYLPCSVSYEYILTASHFNNIDITRLFFVSKLSEKFWITEFILFIPAFSFCSKELKLHPYVNSSLHFPYFPKSPTPNHIPMGVTICSDFGAPQNKVCHCLHCFPIYLPWSDGTGWHDLSFLNIEF